MTEQMTDEPRWVGVTPPDGDAIQACEHYAGWLARRYADGVLADIPEHELEWRLADYRATRDTLATWQSIYDHMWRDGGRDGRFAGWFVLGGLEAIPARG